MAGSVRTGLEALARDGFRPLLGRRVGLIANHTAVDANLDHAADRLRAELGDGLKRLFAPEHGLRGEAQDMVGVEDARDERTGLEVVSLYGSREETLSPSVPATADLDVLVFDIQDIGSRYYTFQATMALAMRAAGARGLDFVVLDRPNPIGGIEVEGNQVDADYRSFVGIEPIAVRHGLTVGELARYYVAHCGIDVNLTVIPVAGWRRRDWWDQTGLAWVPPSPNMPTLDTAAVYPGMCLVEGTNLSEGRGTTRPFELVGAPWLDPRALRSALEAEDLPGVKFRDVRFRPTFHKHQGLVCGGVQLHLTDRQTFRPFLTGIAVVRAARELAPDRFDWRREPYEFVADRLAFDLLAGNSRIRVAIEDGTPIAAMAAAWEPARAAFAANRESVLLYESR